MKSKWVVTMPGLNKPLSVRLSDEDMTFLSGYDGGEAVTPSEKVRTLIQRARRQRISTVKPDMAHKSARHFLVPIMAYVQQREGDTGQHSELLATELGWCEDLISDLLILQGQADSKTKAPETDKLIDIEAKLTSRLFLMIDRLLRYALTRQAPAYDPDILSKHLSAIDEILDFLKLRMETLKKEANDA